jgi:hypothetical protein
MRLIWSLDALSLEPHLEAVVARKVSLRPSPKLFAHIEAFGILWRLTG